MNWRYEAACRYAAGLPPDAWFPVGKFDSDTRRRLAEPALRVCQTCPVQRECAGEAMKLASPCGIWGGVDLGDPKLSATQFAEVRRQRRVDLEWVAIGGAL